MAYGPFPVRRGRLAGSFAALIVTFIALFIALEENQLTCAADARCTLRTAIVPSGQPLPAARLRAAKVAIETGSKGAKHGVVVLVFDGGTEVRLMQVPPEQASEAAREITSGLEAKRPIDVTIHGPRFALLVALGAAIMWITMLHAAVKGVGRMRLDLVQGGAALRVTRRILGIPLSARELSIEGAADVRVETGTLGDMWRSRSAEPTAAGRLVVVDRSGQSSSVTERMFPGQAVHLRAASELRALLGFERQPGGVEDQLSSLPRLVTPLNMRLTYAFVGASIGSLLGIVGGVVFFALAIVPKNDATEMVTFVVGGICGVVAGVALALTMTRARARR